MKEPNGTPTLEEQAYEARQAKLKELALTYYEDRKAATSDEVEIDLIEIIEKYWNDK
jgi:hypothetical protein